MKSDLGEYLDLERMLRLYAMGYGSTAIARELAVSHETVQKAIRKAAEEARERNAELVEERFLQQDQGLLRLYRHCMDRIETAAAAGEYDKEAVKGIIMVMDRQAKLLGMDKAKATGAKNLYGWLDTASETELNEAAERYGIALPKPFGAPHA